MFISLERRYRRYASFLGYDDNSEILVHENAIVCKIIDRFDQCFVVSGENENANVVTKVTLWYNQWNFHVKIPIIFQNKFDLLNVRKTLRTASHLTLSTWGNVFKTPTGKRNSKSHWNVCAAWCAQVSIKSSTEQLFYAIFHFCIGIFPLCGARKNLCCCCGCFVYKQTNGNARHSLETSNACTQFECYFCSSKGMNNSKRRTSMKLKIARQTKYFVVGQILNTLSVIPMHSLAADSAKALERILTAQWRRGRRYFDRRSWQFFWDFCSFPKLDH